MLFPSIPQSGSQILAWARKISDYIKEISPRAGAGIKVNRTPGGSVFSVKPYQPDPFHFACDLSAYNQVTVRSGRLLTQGGVPTPNITVAEDTVTLAGSDAFVYILHEWGTQTATIEVVSVEPLPTATHAVWVLTEWTAIAAGKYKLIDTWRIGDIDLASPIV